MRLDLYAYSPMGTTYAQALTMSVKSGVPGGCGIPRIFEVAMNYPASQKVTVGASVQIYPASTTAKTPSAARYGGRSIG